MRKDREELIQRFEKWLATNPNPRIIADQCANIAEEYAEKVKNNSPFLSKMLIRIVVLTVVREREFESIIFIKNKFGLTLRVGDLLIIDEEKPVWAKKWENGKYIYCNVIKLTERTFGGNLITFEAKAMD
tara:strand:+ start:3561 stop:3950 length:390 start_codon:yes stop_codon:yes gene_type:complete